MKIKLPIKKSERGVTLIELLVAISIFVLIVGVNVNIFISSTKAQKRSAEVQDVVDAVRYASEVIARELRYMNLSGTLNGGCTLASCITSDGEFSEIAFISGSKNRLNKVIKFSLVNGRIMMNDDLVGNPSGDVAITPANVKVNSLIFNVFGVSATSQPRVTLIINAESADSLYGKTSTIQITISPRELNL